MPLFLGTFLGLLPNQARAGFFSIVADFISEEHEEIYTTTTSSSQNIQTMPLLKGDLSSSGGKGGGDITIVEGSALVSEVGPLGTLSDVVEDQNHQIVIHTVHKGETLSQIAEMFGVSKNTIVWANDIKGSIVAEGQKLVILPVPGVMHRVKSGETIKGIALKYKADKEEILAYNDLNEDDVLKIDQTIIIPDAEMTDSTNMSKSEGSQKSVPNGFFIKPVNGVVTQGPHGYKNSGIDIGAPFGTQVVASASGVVIVSKSSGWNGGYGSYIVARHQYGKQTLFTLYSHLSSVEVFVGETVSQGQRIGTVGSTGKSTGYHLHFERRGVPPPLDPLY